MIFMGKASATKKIAILLCLFLSLTMPSFASSWYWIGNNNGANVYVDNGSVQKYPDHTELWVKVTDVPQPNSINAVAYLFKVYVKPDASGCFTYIQVLFADGHTQDVKTDVDIYPFPPGSVGYMVWRSTY
jgi:prepilin-type processing-associated H-X9-DG protein